MFRYLLAVLNRTACEYLTSERSLLAGAGKAARSYNVFWTLMYCMPLGQTRSLRLRASETETGEALVDPGEVAGAENAGMH